MARRVATPLSSKHSRPLVAFLFIVQALDILQATPLSNDELRERVQQCRQMVWDTPSNRRSDMQTTSLISDLSLHADCSEVGSWDTSMITDMSSLFKDSSFNGDISRWSTSNVTNMRGMFWRAPSFNVDLSTWDTSSVTEMRGMFYAAKSFNGDVSRWDTSLVTNMRYMFESASSFNRDVSLWNTAAVTDMGYMFEDAYVFNQNLTLWDVSRVERMNDMFDNASAFNGDVSGWDPRSVITMRHMFDKAHSFNGDVSAWNVSNVKEMNYLFRHAHSFNEDLSRWDTSSAGNMHGMLQSAFAFNGDISSWNVGKAYSMASMFEDAFTFNCDISQWDVRGVSSMASMFQNASAFNANISGWNTGRVSNMNGLFHNATSFNQDLCAWNTDSVDEMAQIFDGCPKLSFCDVDECLSSSPEAPVCDTNIVCHNTDGGYQCGDCGPVLEAARGCDVWVRHDLTVGAGDIPGKVCVGGSFTVRSGGGLSTGTALEKQDCSAQDADYALVVAGDVSWESGTKSGGAHCVGGRTLIDNPQGPLHASACAGDRVEDAGQCIDVIDFASDHGKLLALSDDLYGSPDGFTRGAFAVENGAILLSVDASQPRHVFHLDAELFEGWGTWAVRIRAERGSMEAVQLVVVNFVNLPASGLVIARQFDYPASLSTKVLFNYAGSHSLALGAGVTMHGSLLAPRSRLSGMSAGIIHGQVVVDAFESTVNSAAQGFTVSRLAPQEVCLSGNDAPSVPQPALSLDDSWPGVVAEVQESEKEGDSGDDIDLKVVGIGVAVVALGICCVGAAFKQQSGRAAEQARVCETKAGVAGLFEGLHGLAASKDGGQIVEQEVTCAVVCPRSDKAALSSGNLSTLARVEAMV